MLHNLISEKAVINSNANRFRLVFSTEALHQLPYFSFFHQHILLEKR